MKFSDSIALYVQHKNTMGVEFATGERYLVALSRRVGATDLSRIKSNDLLSFLDDSTGQVETWRMKYAVLIHFFDFWAAREEIPYLSFPPPKPPVRPTFVPYVYSRAEVRALVRLRKWNFKTSLSPITLRTFLLFLYATGAMVGEAMALSVEDIDLKKRVIVIRSKSITRFRRIPISEDLCDVLRKYLMWRVRRNVHGLRLFVGENGDPVGYDVLEKCFRKQCNSLGIRREQSSTYQPRMHDLKCAFAVHRITSWIRNGIDLNRMLPALAAYMGMKLVSTERYFQLTPERFKKQLNKLSPLGFKSHWRHNKELMAFLESL
jgi:integrase/recombinase XerD